MPQDFFTNKVRIVEAMMKVNKPMIMQHIADASKLTPQLVSYHMKQMVEWGIAGTAMVENDGNTYYVLQPAYYDKNWLDSLFSALTPFVEAMGKNIDDSQAEVEKTKAVVRNLSMFLRLFENKIEKLKINSQSTG